MELTAVIGDVHGCIDEYTHLLDILDRDFPKAEKVQVGDTIHKGPDSAACLWLTLSRADRLVVGNHELKHIRWIDWEARVASGEASSNPMKHVEEYPSMGFGEAEYNAIKEHSLLYYQRPGLLVTHAGVLPKIRSLPQETLFYKLSKREQNYYKSLTMTRFVDPSGNMVQMGCETPQDSWWAETYDGRFGHVIYGHQHYMEAEPIEYPHATGIDLGCVYGGHLCAVIVADGVVVEAITVEAARQYKEPLKLEK